jgi:hypothetical protein
MPVQVNCSLALPAKSSYVMSQPMLAENFPLVAIAATLLCVLAFAADASAP